MDADLAVWLATPARQHARRIVNEVLAEHAHREWMRREMAAFRAREMAALSLRPPASMRFLVEHLGGA